MTLNLEEKASRVRLNVYTNRTKVFSLTCDYIVRICINRNNTENVERFELRVMSYSEICYPRVADECIPPELLAQLKLDKQYLDEFYFGAWCPVPNNSAESFP